MTLIEVRICHSIEPISQAREHKCTSTAILKLDFGPNLSYGSFALAILDRKIEALTA